MQGMPGAIRCVGFMGNDVFKEGPIGKPSALLVLEARPSTDEDPRSRLGAQTYPGPYEWFEQNTGGGRGYRREQCRFPLVCGVALRHRKCL